jgi:TPR repeat protein
MSGGFKHNRPWSRLLFAPALALLLSGIANAGLKEGLEASAAEDYERSYREVLPLAQAGHPLAQFLIGQAYRSGRGVLKDDAQALEWFKRAADGGNVQAQVNLARSYQLGEGTLKDYQAALKWYLRAAEQGRETAYIGLAEMYKRGEGVDADPAIALRWLTQAAQKDHPAAQYELGRRYWQGRGSDRDFDAAYEWFTKSASQNYVPAMVSLGTMFFGDGRSLDTVSACTYLKLAQQLGVKRPDDAALIDSAIQNRCNTLPPQQQRAVADRMGKWEPRKVWFERQQREFQELVQKAGEEDLRRGQSQK